MHGATRSLEPSQRSPPPFCTAGKADAGTDSHCRVSTPKGRILCRRAPLAHRYNLVTGNRKSSFSESAEYPNICREYQR